jgi:LmbE family N-acetylglucosaminyl deacetylase
MLPAVFGKPGAPLEILCLGAHCDDIEIGCGGTLLRLLKERPGSTVIWTIFSSTPEREAEARSSAAVLLADAARAEVNVATFRDGYFPALWGQIKDRFEQLKQEVRPDLVFTPHRQDRHQDHRAVAELTWNTFRDHVVLEYEIPKYEGDLGRPNLFVPLPDAVARRKIDTILHAFRSQKTRRWWSAQTFEAVLRLRGVECNAAEGWAEAFHADKLVI